MARVNYNADRLAFAVIGQAMQQATGRGPKAMAARAWLLSDEARYLTEPLEMDVIIPEWVNRGCPRQDGRLLKVDKYNDRNWHEYYLKRKEREK